MLNFIVLLLMLKNHP